MDLLICCRFFSFLRLLLLGTRTVSFVPAHLHQVEDTDLSLQGAEGSVPVDAPWDWPAQL